MNRQAERVARAVVRWTPRGDRHPNLPGAITIEQALPAGCKLRLSGWTRRRPARMNSCPWSRQWRSVRERTSDARGAA
jgi:hypothetical protein